MVILRASTLRTTATTGWPPAYVCLEPWGGGIELITFYIDGVSFTAEKGMTWEKWLNSSYNNTSFTIEGNQVVLSGISYIDEVTPSDVIIAGTHYYQM